MSIKSSTRIKLKRRSGDPWISTNRVLNSNSASKKNGMVGRNPNFDTDETKLLIQLWGDPKVQRTLITTHKKHAVICQLATKMQEYGYYRSAEEITTRIKNLKCFYNRLKKDIEDGNALNAQPSWKHFNEMDAIMTRPIFSVRPNEVPTPSLKYQMEMAREAREERKKKVLEEGGSLSESDDDLQDILAMGKANYYRNEIDDGIIPDMEVDININEDGAFVTLGSEKSQKSNKSDGSDHDRDCSSTEPSLKIKEEGNDSNLSEAEFPPNDIESNSASTAKEKGKGTNPTNQTANSTKPASDKNAAKSVLMIPKEEPIDVDAEDSSSNTETTAPKPNVQALMPTLADFLQMSKGNLAISSAGMVLPMANITTVASSSTSNSTTTSASTTQGKISLVPTNFLMQPTANAMPMQQQQIHLLPGGINSQPRLVLSNAQPGQASNGNTGIVASGPNGMKVLLVNAEQAGAGGQLINPQQLTTVLGKPMGTVLNSATTAFVQQQQQQQHQQKQQQQQQQQQKQKQQQQQQKQLQHQQEQKEALQQQKKKLLDKERRERREELMSKHQATGMRILMRQLLAMQTESNRLQRERLDWEKSVVERFFTALPTFFNQQQQQQQIQQQQQQLQQQLQQQQQQQQQQKFQQQIVTTPTVIGNIGRMTPNNRLVFTSTTLPNGGTILTPATRTANIIKTNATMQPLDITSQINDNTIQLLTPKVEKED